MKTKTQIIDYIKSKPWYNKFIDNFIKLGFGTLRFDESLITSPFNWDDTPEGQEYWINVQEEYNKWYTQPTLDEMRFTYITSSIPTVENRPAYKLILLNKLFIIRDKNISNKKCQYKLETVNDEVVISYYPTSMQGLSFPTKEKAEEFLNTFYKELDTIKEYL